MWDLTIVTYSYCLLGVELTIVAVCGNQNFFLVNVFTNQQKYLGGLNVTRYIGIEKMQSDPHVPPYDSRELEPCLQLKNFAPGVLGSLRFSSRWLLERDDRLDLSGGYFSNLLKGSIINQPIFIGGHNQYNSQILTIAVHPKRLPSGKLTYVAIENNHLKILDLPLKNGGSFHRLLLTFTRGYPKKFVPFVQRQQCLMLRSVQCQQQICWFFVPNEISI